jgi:hypothetical protein
MPCGWEREGGIRRQDGEIPDRGGGMGGWHGKAEI